MPTLMQNLRALPRPAWVLFGGTFINRFGTFVMPFLAIYMTREGFTPTQAGIAVSSYGAGHILASMIGGHLADRIGRRHTIALSMFLSSAAMLGLSQVHTFKLIVLFAFLVGLVGEIYRPAATAPNRTSRSFNTTTTTPLRLTLSPRGPRLRSTELFLASSSLTQTRIQPRRACRIRARERVL